MKKIIFKLFIFTILMFSIFSLGVVYSSLNQEISVTGTANVPNRLPAPEIVVEHTTTTSTQGAWITYNINITVRNDGNANSYSWNFDMSAPSDATELSCWGVVCSISGSALHIQNETYNGLLIPGESTTAGVTFKSKNPDYVPEDPIIEEPPQVDLGVNLVVDAILSNTWGNGNNRTFQYNVVITNNNEVDVLWWRADFLKDQYAFTVDSIWNAIYVDSATSLRVSNQTWNGTIAPGASISFGMQLKNKDRNFTITASNIKAGA